MSDDNFFVVQDYLGHRLENQTLKESLDKFEECIQCDDDQFGARTEYMQVHNLIKSKINNKEISQGTENDAKHALIFGKFLEIERLSSTLTLGYFCLAKIAFENGETDKSWRYFSEAKYHLALADISNSLNNQKFAMPRTEAARKGGTKASENRKNKNSAINKAKDEAIRLIEECRPTNGWENELQMKKSIIKPLDTFVKNPEFTNQPWAMDMNSTLSDWLINDNKFVTRCRKSFTKAVAAANKKSNVKNPQ